MKMHKETLYTKYLKRIFDIILSFIALIVLSPVMLIVALLVKIKLGSPIIFKQKRPGLKGKIFNLYKFRTMSNEKDSNGNLLPDDVRLTKFGKALRSTSLDELPSLINIIKGEMSIVGPRPLLVKYLPYYSKQELTRHDTRPGLTGLAQINGRNLLNWDDRLKYDVFYVENISFLQDIIIVFKTVSQVIARKNITVGETHVMKNLDIERGNNEN